MPVLDRAEQRRDDAEQQQRHGTGDRPNAGRSRHGDECNTDLGKFQSPGDDGLVVAVGELAAEESGEEKVGRDEDRGSKGAQGVRFRAADMNKIRKTSEFLRKLSLNAEKN